MNVPKISVIIPSWNAAPYLERCFDSIQNQTFAEFEVIVVDVESTDNTAAIVESYARKDPRFAYFKHSFSPCGIGRNFGIDMSTSPFIAFADADDVLKPDMLETMYNAAISENADIVVCDFDMVYPDKRISSFSRMNSVTWQISEENLAEYYFRYNAAPKPNNYAWSRLYRKEFIQKTGIRFKHVLTSEDHLFNLMLSCSMPRIVHVAKSVYDYIQRDDSSVRLTARNTNQGQTYFSIFNIAREFLESRSGNYTSPILSIYAFTRLRSILFYGKLANLSGATLQESLSAFLNGEKVRHYLELCLNNGHLANYCQLHGIPADQVHSFRELIEMCLLKEMIAADKGWFQ